MGINMLTTISKSHCLKFMVIILASVGLFCVGCGADAQAKNPDKSAVAIDVSEDEQFDDDFDFLEEEFEEEFAEKTVDVADPLESVNRLMFDINDTLYFWVLKPVTDGYISITSEPQRGSIRSFFDNLSTPVRYVSCLVQGKGERADVELRRLLINSTEGILGFWDPAKNKHGLESPPAEDLGQALAVHGVGDGFYLVLPLMGPSTARDALGKFGGIYLSPVYYVNPDEAAIGIAAGKFTNELSFHTGEYESFKSDSLDPYVAMREIYMQYRDKQIKE
jgi:phospholipid-binding lipoprotein MlaA